MSRVQSPSPTPTLLKDSCVVFLLPTKHSLTSYLSKVRVLFKLCSVPRLRRKVLVSKGYFMPCSSLALACLRKRRGVLQTECRQTLQGLHLACESSHLALGAGSNWA